MIKIEHKALKYTKDIIIYNLRLYLNNQNNYSIYLPSQLDEMHFINTKVYDTQPEDLREFPVIIISNGSGDMITNGLGDMAMEIFDPRTSELIAYRYGGMYDFNLSIEIGTRSTLEREVLADLVTRALRFDIRREIEHAGILVKSMRFAGESVLQYDSNFIYVSTINFSTWSEWYEDIKLLPNVDVHINSK